MSYIGNSPAPFFTAVTTDVFSANGTGTDFALSRRISNLADIEVIVDNIQQNPFSGSYSVSGTTLSFSAAPSAGSNNVVVTYRQATIGSSIPTPNTVGNSALQSDLNLTGNTTTQNILPAANVTYDIGSTDMRYRDLYLSGNTIQLGAVSLSTNNDTFVVANTTGGVLPSELGNTTVTGTLTTSETIVVGNTTVNTIIHSTGITANGANIHSVNAATVGGNTASDLRSYSSNASNISSGTLDTARLPATANIATAVNVGANVSLSTSSIRIGNTTVNSNHVDVASGGSYRINNTAILYYSTASSGTEWLLTVRPMAVGTSDLRNPAPNQFPNGRISPLFTSMNLNNGSPYGDAIHFSTYGDHTGGSPNIFVINKSSNEVKISRGSWDSSTAYNSGSIYTLNYTSASDSSVKEDVHDITNGLEVITNLRPVTYKWTDEYILAGFSKNRQENNVDEEGRIVLPNEKAINVGLIAQEVQEVLPTVVHNDNVSLPGTEEFLLNVSYEKIVPHLIAAIKEQQHHIDLLKDRVQALEQ